MKILCINFTQMVSQNGSYIKKCDKKNLDKAMCPHVKVGFFIALK
jgi:hypothetical protein